MKFLFIVQGEGRGHFTQAITLEEMLLRNGHEVVEVLVGKSSTRTLPGFFNRSIHAPVKRFISPNFLPTADNKRANLTKSFAYNLLRLPEYLRSMYYINQRIRETGAEVVINFYELLLAHCLALLPIAIVLLFLSIPLQQTAKTVCRFPANETPPVHTGILPR